MPYMKRYLGRVAFSSGATSVFPLPREHFYNRLLLDFECVAQASTANTYVANAHKLLATNISIIANGQLVIKSFSEYQKYINNYLNYGTPSYEIGAGVAADNTARSLYIVIEFGINTADVTCVLPSQLLSSLDLRITWNTTAALTGGGTLNTSQYCDVYSLELINQGQDASAAIINKETVLTLTPASTGFTEFNLPLGNVYRQFTLFTQGGATGTGYHNDTVTDIQVVQDGVVYHRNTFYLENLAETIIESAGIIDPTVAQGTGLSPTQTASMNAGAVLLMFDYQNWNAGGSSNPVALVNALPHMPDSSKMATFKVRCNIPSVANAIVLDLLMQELILPKVRRQ